MRPFGPWRDPASARSRRVRLGASGRLPAPPTTPAARAQRPSPIDLQGAPGRLRGPCSGSWPLAPAARLPACQSVWAPPGSDWLPGVSKGTTCIVAVAVAVAGVSGAVSSATVQGQRGIELSLPSLPTGELQGSTCVWHGVFHKEPASVDTTSSNLHPTC